MNHFFTDEPIKFEGTFYERCENLKELIVNNKTVFFGGAGVSTASGIPDFRSSDGLYNQKNEYTYKPEDILSKGFLNHNPKMFYKFYRDKFDLRKFEPNDCHKKLAEMEKLGYMTGIITQNVDCLHQKAGSKNVAEIHGTISDNYCLKCKSHYNINYIFENKDIIPRCSNCNSSNNFVRPKVTLYGERLDNDILNKAYEYLYGEIVDGKRVNKPNLMIVGGTSLQVMPASSFVSDYYGKYLVIINREETPYDKYANIIFREDINEVFKNLKFN